MSFTHEVYMFEQQFMNALAIGSVYALTAMGATLIYGIMGILDIANAGAYLVGAYLGWYIYHATGNIALAFIGSAIAVGALGVLLQKTIYSPILAKQNTLSIIPLVAAVGLFTMSSDVIRLICGPYSKSYNFKTSADSIQIGPIVLIPAWILIFALTALCLLVLWFLLNRTKLGLAWRSTANDSEIAKVCGVDTYRFSKTFTGQYIDADGQESTRSYSMLVRSYELYEATDLTLIGEKMERAGVAHMIILNEIPYRIVNLTAAAPVICDDIKNNASRGICKHKLQ